MCLYLTSQVDTEYDLGLQDMVDNAEECIVMMEAAGVRMNVSSRFRTTMKTMYSVPVTWVPDLKRSRDDVSDDEPAAKR
jgi:hypothetical protein